MKLTAVIPVYNEQNTLKDLVERVLKAKVPEHFSKEVIVIDDCSTDTTLAIAKGLAKDHGIKVLQNNRNMGKGVSVIKGIQASTGDVVVIQDADLEYNPEEYALMLEPIISQDADVVYGSRFMGGKPHRVLYFWHYLGNKALTLFSNMMTNLNLTDMETCYKMFTRKVADDIKHKLKSKRFGFDPEITALVKHYSVYEVGISYKGRTYAEGKKIGWKDGFVVLFAIIRFNLFH